MNLRNTLIWTVLYTSLIYRNNVVYCTGSQRGSNTGRAPSTTPDPGGGRIGNSYEAKDLSQDSSLKTQQTGPSSPKESEPSTQSTTSQETNPLASLKFADSDPEEDEEPPKHLEPPKQPEEQPNGFSQSPKSASHSTSPLSHSRTQSTPTSGSFSRTPPARIGAAAQTRTRSQQSGQTRTGETYIVNLRTGERTSVTSGGAQPKPKATGSSGQAAKTGGSQASTPKTQTGVSSTSSPQQPVQQGGTSGSPKAVITQEGSTVTGQSPLFTPQPIGNLYPSGSASSFDLGKEKQPQEQQQVQPPQSQPLCNLYPEGFGCSVFVRELSKPSQQPPEEAKPVQQPASTPALTDSSPESGSTVPVAEGAAPPATPSANDDTGTTPDADQDKSSEAPTTTTTSDTSKPVKLTAVELNIKDKKGTTQFSYNKTGKVVTFEAKDGFGFSSVKTKKGSCCSNKTDVDIWQAKDATEYATKVVLYGKSKKIKTVIIHLPNDKKKFYYRLEKNKPWVEGTGSPSAPGQSSSSPTSTATDSSKPAKLKGVELSLKVKKGTKEFRYSEKGKAAIYKAKIGYGFSSVKTKSGGCDCCGCFCCGSDVSIWDAANESEYARAVILEGKGSKVKRVIIYLLNNEKKSYYRLDKNQPWVEGTSPSKAPSDKSNSATDTSNTKNGIDLDISKKDFALDYNRIDGDYNVIFYGNDEKTFKSVIDGSTVIWSSNKDNEFVTYVVVNNYGLILRLENGDVINFNKTRGVSGWGWLWAVLSCGIYCCCSKNHWVKEKPKPVKGNEDKFAVNATSGATKGTGTGTTPSSGGSTEGGTKPAEGTGEASTTTTDGGTDPSSGDGTAV